MEGAWPVGRTSWQPTSIPIERPKNISPSLRKCGFEKDYHNEKIYERYADPKFDQMTGGLSVYITFLRFRKKGLQ